MLRFFETILDPFRAHDESMPPANLLGYYGRYCRQVWPFLAALMTISLIVSLIEVTILRFVGALVDMLRSTSPDEVLRAHGRRVSGHGAPRFSSGVRWRASPMTSSCSKRSRRA